MGILIIFRELHVMSVMVKICSSLPGIIFEFICKDKQTAKQIDTITISLPIPLGGESKYWLRHSIFLIITDL